MQQTRPYFTGFSLSWCISGCYVLRALQEGPTQFDLWVAALLLLMPFTLDEESVFKKSSFNKWDHARNFLIKRHD
jgi:hypothetical protein